MMNHRGYAQQTGGVTDTINPADKNAAITLSGGNLTASYAGAGFAAARSVNSFAAAKRYLEATSNGLSGGGGGGLGIGNAAASLSNFVGANNNSIGLGSQGVILIGGAAVAGGAGDWSAAGFVGQVAVDMGAKLFWGRAAGGSWNGSGAADPATGVGGISLAVVGSPWFAMLHLFTNPDSMTLNFGATAFTGPVPSGFSAFG